MASDPGTPEFLRSTEFPSINLILLKPEMSKFPPYKLLRCRDIYETYFVAFIPFVDRFLQSEIYRDKYNAQSEFEGTLSH